MPVPSGIGFEVWEPGQAQATGTGAVGEGGALSFSGTPLFFSTKLEFRLSLSLSQATVKVQGKSALEDRYVASAYRTQDGAVDQGVVGEGKNQQPGIPEVTPANHGSFQLILDREARGAFHVLERVARGYTFAEQTLLDTSGSPQFSRLPVAIHWGPVHDARSVCDNAPACYQSGVDVIQLSAPHAWDPYVLFHEFGHFADDKTIGLPPGGLKEGFGDYFAARVGERDRSNLGTFLVRCDAPGSGEQRWCEPGFSSNPHLFFAMSNTNGYMHQPWNIETSLFYTDDPNNPQPYFFDLGTRQFRDPSLKLDLFGKPWGEQGNHGRAIVASLWDIYDEANEGAQNLGVRDCAPSFPTNISTHPQLFMC